MTDNDEVPNAERDDNMALFALALILIAIMATLAGAWWAAR